MVENRQDWRRDWEGAAVIEILEANYTLKASEGELRTLLKAIRCMPLYSDQDPELAFEELTTPELTVLRQLRAQLDFLS